MITPQEALQRTIEHREIFHDEMLHIVRLIMSGECSPVMMAALITGLRVKKETIGEITAAAQVMREVSTKVAVADTTNLVDIVGTGGDGSHTFNISTCSMFVAAAAGAKVSKHGGRSVSSKSGSADVLESLGVNINLKPEQIARSIEQAATGFMFAPLERAFPHRRAQRLFRTEWREDLFYYLVSTMFVQILGFLALAPQAFVNDHTSSWAAFRAGVAALPWIAQFAIVLFVSDLAQYWYHRLFHKIPFLWGFHAIHHSAKSMDWLAGSRMHFVEIILLRSITSLPLFTLGFSPSVMQAYIGFVYVWSSDRKSVV